MSALLDLWQVAASDLGFVVDGPVTIEVGGTRMSVPVFVEGFGAVRGMLIVTSYSDVKPHIEALAHAGFGYSVMSEPRQNETYDRESFIEMLSDWGWSGSPQERPAWVVD